MKDGIEIRESAVAVLYPDVRRSAVAIVCPTLDLEMAKETFESIADTAGRYCLSVIAHDTVRQGWVKTALRGIEEALVSGYPYICLVNEDIRIEQQGWLARMVEAIEQDELYGMATPSGNCRTMPVCYGKPGMPKRIRVLKHIPFFCTLIKSQVLESLDMILDEEFIHYGGDSDLCERLALTPYNAILVQDVFVDNPLSPLIPEWKQRDQELFRKKWGW